MANIDVMYSSKTDRWATPEDFFEELDKEFQFVKGRLKFGNSKQAAPFPSMVVIFRGAGM